MESNLLCRFFSSKQQQLGLFKVFDSRAVYSAKSVSRITLTGCRRLRDLSRVNSRLFSSPVACLMVKSKAIRNIHVEGLRPDWYISTISHAWDTQFWSGTLDFLCV